MCNELARERWGSRLIFILIVVGIFLRVNRYLCGFPFWGDEAWVAQEVLRRTGHDILFNAKLLPSLGMPPIGFLLLERFLVLLVDCRELVFRFVPCACGVASIFLFRKLLQGLVSPCVMLMAFTFFIFSNQLIYYSSELKQYSLDVFFVLLFLLVHFRILKNPMDHKGTVRLATVGLGALFFSLPIILVLCGTALVQIAVFVHKKMFGEMRRYVVVGVMWLTGFWVLWRSYYHVNYVGQEVLSYKQPYYLSCPWIHGNWGVWFQKLLSVFQNPVELTWPWLAAVMFLVGCWSLWEKSKPLMLVLVAPIVLTAGLSVLDRYPFYGRFIIFLLPIMFIFIAQGIEYVMNGCCWRRIVGWIILVALLFQPIANARNYVVPASDTDVRSLVAYIRAHQKQNDSVYFNNDAQWGYFYYCYFYYYLYSHPVPGDTLKERGILYEHALVYDKPGQLFYLLTTDRKKCSRVYSWDRVVDEDGIVSKMPGGGRTWVLLSMVAPEKKRAFVSCFDAFGKKLDEQHSHNASLYLYDLK